MTKEEIQKEVKQIKNIYKSYLDRLLVLRQQQDKIIIDFSEVLKNKKIEKIKKQLSSL
ncbi:hypothetical protein IT399_03085 [Candidatus Nomurabacteria bacterium]|nr:hypothetical protein [Candidatus Nomurabacteria bacterium]